MFALLKHGRRKGDDLISGHGALPYTGGSATELSATDACAMGGRAGDTPDMGCPTQPVQCQKHVQANVRFGSLADKPPRQNPTFVRYCPKADETTGAAALSAKCQ
jgi:hypothetical protein